MFDLVAHLYRQRAFSRATFGPGARTKGVLDHIRKEITEVERAPHDLSEWVDLILLSLDGAWRAGFGRAGGERSPGARALSRYRAASITAFLNA